MKPFLFGGGGVHFLDPLGGPGWIAAQLATLQLSQRPRQFWAWASGKPIEELVLLSCCWNPVRLHFLSTEYAILLMSI